MDEHLIVPVYLNQRIVFDLLAMLDNGLSVVERIQAHESSTEERAHSYGAEFGLSKALSGILKIGVSGETEKSDAQQQGITTGKEKYHTPASLLFKLRQALRTRELIRDITADTPPQTHDFIEFTASLQKNPLITSFDAITSVMDMAFAFTDAPSGTKQQRREARREQTENKQLQKQLTLFSEKLRAGDTVDILATGLPSGHRAVITLESSYLNDPMMSDLVDGNFTVLGKVIRVVNESDAGSISLLRKTALTVMKEDTLVQLFNSFGDNEELNLPDPEWEIPAPVLQVIPVGIFA